MKKKKFLYCLSTEGGMDSFEIKEITDFRRIPYWMHSDCSSDDNRLLEWSKTCLIGDYFEHRLGILIRINLVNN